MSDAVSEPPQSPRSLVQLIKRAWQSSMRQRLLPDRSRRARPFEAMLQIARHTRWYGARGLRAETRRQLASLPLLRRWLQRPSLYRPVYRAVDRSQVTLYSDDPSLMPDHERRRPTKGARLRRRKVAVITTVLDERHSVEAWLADLLAQSLAPQQIVIVDGGSKDGTLELLRSEAEGSAADLRVVSAPGSNIAAARNLAIEEADANILAITDAGCRVPRDWLEKIVHPFAADPETEVVAGWYEVVDSKGRPLRYGGWPSLEQVVAQSFLPSSRSLAFSRAAWRRAGGYPEWLTLTGEDTLFALELKRHCRHWGFVPDAKVLWQGPSSWIEYWKKTRAWSSGDGESGVHADYYRRSVGRARALCWTGAGALALAILGSFTGQSVLWPVAALAAVGWIPWAAWVWGFGLRGAIRESGLEIARAAGFLKGARRRPGVEARRYREVVGTVFLLSGVPIDDTGGGARCTQLALELLRRGFLVVFVHRFEKAESVELDLVISHPHLRTSSLEQLELPSTLRVLAETLERKPVIAVVEFPLGDFLPVLDALRPFEAKVVYDLLDEWDSSLGADWYRREEELEVIQRSELLVATAPTLEAALRDKSGRDVLTLPNAVNRHLFDPRREWAPPPDLPPGDWRAIYVGALWGDWFDWQLLRQIAERYREAAIVVVGDYRGQCPDPPSNLHFLGLKPQTELPAYLAHSDVALIPWEVNEITQATSPLKVYEYLAMELPVVAPSLRPLEGLPGLWCARDREDFAGLVSRVRSQSLPLPAMRAFIAKNHWGARVETLLAALGVEGHDVAQPAATGRSG